MLPVSGFSPGSSIFFIIIVGALALLD